jgi:hypothetical protein
MAAKQAALRQQSFAAAAANPSSYQQTPEMQAAVAAGTNPGDLTAQHGAAGWYDPAALEQALTRYGR